MSMRDAMADAPGRVNLIGEHTDYHQGYVLPMPIRHRTQTRLQGRDDRQVVVQSDALDGIQGRYVLGDERPGRGWLDYVQGVTAMLRRLGHDVPGFQAQVVSSIPVGAGLSSSAAFCVSLLRALRALLGLPLGDVTLARVAQSVETDFVGAPVGIMDPMASSLGRDNHALFLDTRALAYQHIPIPASLEIVAIDSGVTHQHAGGEYGARRAESFAAASHLGVAWLRDCELNGVNGRHDLPPLLARRARHVVTENRRVLEAVQALKAGDGPALGQLFTASHESMRDDYEISTPEIDTLVAICEAHTGVYGARMTGGGFGGAVVLVAAAGTRRTQTASIMTEYTARTGQHPSEIC